MPSQDSGVYAQTNPTYIKLKTALSLYNTLQDSPNEEENLLLLASLRDLKIVLEKGQEYRKTAQQQLDNKLQDFRSSLELIAVNRLVRDIELIKCKLSCEKRFDEKQKRKTKTTKRRKDLELPEEGNAFCCCFFVPQTSRTDFSFQFAMQFAFNYLADNLFFERIRKRRQEVLSDVEKSVTFKKSSERFGWLVRPSTAPPTRLVPSEQLASGSHGLMGNTQSYLASIEDSKTERQRISKQVKQVSNRFRINVQSVFGSVFVPLTELPVLVRLPYFVFFVCIFSATEEMETTERH